MSEENEEETDDIVYEGHIGESIEISPEDPDADRVMVTTKVEETVVGPRGRDVNTFMLAVSQFRHIMKDHVSPHDFDESDFYVVFEIPKKLLTKPWQKYLEENHGGVYQLSTAPVEDELTRVIPKIVDKRDQDEGNEDEE